MNKELPITIRPANASDIGFIFNSWLKSFRNSDFAINISNEIYYAEHHKVIESLLKNYNVLVAVNSDDLNQIYGFICGGHTENILTIHYVYVKHTFRKMGIGELLLNSFEHNPEYASIYTHRTKSSNQLSKKYNFIYHPYVGVNSDSYNKKDAE